MKTLADKLEAEADSLYPCDANLKRHAALLARAEKLRTALIRLIDCVELTDDPKGHTNSAVAAARKALNYGRRNAATTDSQTIKQHA